MRLADGLSSRPLTLSDAAGVFEVIAAQERHDTGEVITDLADIVSDWQRPSFDAATCTVGVFAGDRLVGYAEVSGPDRGDAAVLPDHRGRGIGTWLAAWMQDLARSRGSAVIGMPVPQGSDGDRLLAALGYHVRWTSWVLRLPAGTKIPARELPAGYRVREAREADYRACWTVLEDAFLEWAVRDREPFEDFRARVLRRPGFAPWTLRVITDPDGEVVAATVTVLSGTEAFVERVATRADQRGRGLAQALLADTFAVARTHGATRSALSTDSRTGALGLYEKVGMRVASTWVNRAVQLG